MKKLIVFCYVLVLLSMVSACGASAQAGSDLSIQYGDGNSKLSLGMTRAEVEDVIDSLELPYTSFEEPTEPCVTWSAEYGLGEDKVIVWYDGETDVVKALEISRLFDDFCSRWNVDGAISINSSWEEIQKAYTDYIQEGEDFLAYYCDTNGGEPNGDAMILFQFDETGEMSDLYIASMPSAPVNE